MRRLLPYERALIDTLGISKEEYFRFVAYQQQYKDVKEGTLLDVRMGIDPGTIALVLTIVGTLFQVAAALLAPTPKEQAAPFAKRERRFNPRYGFDSAQDLAQYGDPVNLVYCDSTTNPNGGVRVSTSLVWSALQSYGNAQFMQLLSVVGASEIVEIDYERTAFGQTPIRQFGNVGKWLYFKNAGGPLHFFDVKKGDYNDPSRISGADLAYRPGIVPQNAFNGFSQAFSPSSFNAFGIEAPIPINVTVVEREEDGDPVSVNNGVKMENRGDIWPGIYPYVDAARLPFSVGNQVRLVLQQTENNSNLANKQAEEDRLSYSSSLDMASIYKLGSAKFRPVGLDGKENLGTNLQLLLECVEGGYGPEEDYATEDIAEQEKELEKEQLALKEERKQIDVQIANVGSQPIPLAGLSAAQQKVYNAFLGYFNTIEDIIDDIAYVLRKPSELDDYVKEYWWLFPSEIRGIANLVSDLENRVEEKREEITEERQKQSPSESRIAELRVKIATAKEDLKPYRRQLDQYVRDYNFSDQKLFNYLQEIESIANEVNRTFSSVAGYQVVNEGDIGNIVRERRSRGDKLNAKEERKYLKRVRNVMKEIQLRVASVYQIDQQAMDERLRQFTSRQAAIDVRLAEIDGELNNENRLNDYLGTKCLVKVNEASYETVSPCKVVNFAMKTRVFMRIQNRQKKYGEVKVDQYRQSDNGIKTRSAFFTVSVKKVSDSQYAILPVIFAVRRAADNDYYFPLFFEAPSSNDRWSFKFEPVFDTPSEIRKIGGNVNFVYLNGGQKSENIKNIPMSAIPGASFKYYGSDLRDAGSNNLPPRNRSPWGIDEWTLYSTSSDANIQFSFDNGPEFQLVAVTEQQQVDDYNSRYANIYDGMCLLGFNAYSGKSIRSLRSLSVFVTKGKKVKLIDKDAQYVESTSNAAHTNGMSMGASNFAPDIFLDTIRDERNGIGKYASIEGIDLARLASAKKMCQRMGYYMDGVIADITSWREFWAEVAPYSMLELARIGGRDTLIPALPTTADGTIFRTVTISALFNQGNIIEDSYKEEFIDYGDSTRDLIATVIYRAPENNGTFPKNTSVTVSLKGVGNSEDARRATFDLSQFVTDRIQAINYGMLLCAQRRYVRRAIEFKTFPTEAAIEPGSFIYVQIDENRWDQLTSGVVDANGALNIPLAESPINGTYQVLLYNGVDNVVTLSSVSVSNNAASALSAYDGWLFVLGAVIRNKRIFKVTEVEMDEEGEVTVRASEHPCEEVGGKAQSLIARQELTLYDIEG
jgi:hypothetical protein